MKTAGVPLAHKKPQIRDHPWRSFQNLNKPCTDQKGKGRPESHRGKGVAVWTNLGTGAVSLSFWPLHRESEGDLRGVWSLGREERGPRRGRGLWERPVLWETCGIEFDAARHKTVWSEGRLGTKSFERGKETTVVLGCQK